MNRASSATGWVRNPVMKSPELDPHLADSYELGWTWNPFTGCLNGCEYCYARKLANTRLRERYLANGKYAPSMTVADIDNPFYPRLWPERLDELDISKQKYCQFREGKGIFPCDMSDLFGVGIPEEWTRKVLRIIKMNWHHRFYLLTKQPQNLPQWSPFPDNCWVGVTATDYAMLSNACENLRKVEAKTKYISFEPLLSMEWSAPNIQYWLIEAGINWVIIGAQTKPYRPPKIEWVQEIVEAADKVGIPVFLKDNLKPLFYKHITCRDEWALTKTNLYKGGLFRQEMPACG